MKGTLIAFWLVCLVTTPVSAWQDSQAPREEEEEQPQEDPSLSDDEVPPQFEEQVLVEGTVEAIPTFDTTFAKVPLSLQSTPASVGVVPQFLFQSQNANVLGDALENVSGVNVATGFGVFDFFVIRGMDSLDTGLVMTDGAFEPEATFYQLYNVERVEVLKGPAAFLYGGNPLSGTVNLIRRQPLRKNQSDLKLYFGQFQSFQGMADVNLARSDGRVQFRLNAVYTGSDFYRDDKQSDSFAVNPAVTLHLNDRTPLTVNFEYVNNEYKPDSGLPLLGNQLPDVPRTRSYQSPLDISDQEIYRLRVDFSSEVNRHLTIRDKFYFTDLDWQSDGTLLVGAFPNAAGSVDVFRNMLLLDDRQKLLGNQLEALLSFSTGKVGHSVLVGFEASRLDDEFTLDVAFLPPIDLFNPVEFTTEPLFLIPAQSTAADARSIVLAPYFVDQMSFSRAVQFFVGGRWDALDYEDPVTGTARDTTDFSPMVGGVYSPRANLSFYANYSQAFAPPSSRVVGEREPEESWQFEVGVKKQFGGSRGSATVAFYNLERDTIAIPDADGFTQQTGNQRSRGLEVELATQVPPDWFTFVSYAFNDSELTEFNENVFTGADPPVITFDRSGNAAPFAPQHIFNLWTIREFSSGLGLGGGVRYVSGQFIAPDNAYKIDGYLTLGATLFYRVGSWRLGLNLENLTDRDYETRGFGSSAVIPANPFAVYGSIQFFLK
jgi:iron complex outermembrane receptor protein